MTSITNRGLVTTLCGPGMFDYWTPVWSTSCMLGTHIVFHHRILEHCSSLALVLFYHGLESGIITKKDSYFSLLFKYILNLHTPLYVRTSNFNESHLISK